VERTGKAAVEDSRQAITKLIGMMSCYLGLRRNPLDDGNAAIVHSKEEARSITNYSWAAEPDEGIATRNVIPATATVSAPDGQPASVLFPTSPLSRNEGRR
jgi:hypothetical protein